MENNNSKTWALNIPKYNNSFESVVQNIGTFTDSFKKISVLAKEIQEKINAAIQRIQEWSEYFAEQMKAIAIAFRSNFSWTTQNKPAHPSIRNESLLDESILTPSQVDIQPPASVIYNQTTDHCIDHKPNLTTEAESARADSRIISQHTIEHSPSNAKNHTCYWIPYEYICYLRVVFGMIIDLYSFLAEGT
ncbi:unknown [Methanoculleus sp. CAG:1088]|nr:unknown [Methanoculleus sp. CAG:1088]